MDTKKILHLVERNASTFFKDLKPGQVFTYSFDLYDAKSVRLLCRENKVLAEYCPPGTPEYKEHGGSTFKVIRLLDDNDPLTMKRGQKVVIKNGTIRNGEEVFFVKWMQDVKAHSANLFLHAKMPKDSAYFATQSEIDRWGTIAKIPVNSSFLLLLALTEIEIVKS